MFSFVDFLDFRRLVNTDDSFKIYRVHYLLLCILQVVKPGKKVTISNKRKNVRKVIIVLKKKNPSKPVSAEVVVKACFHPKTTTATPSPVISTTGVTTTGVKTTGVATTSK